jgi:hypothetical protein
VKKEKKKINLSHKKRVKDHGIKKKKKKVHKGMLEIGRDLK